VPCARPGKTPLVAGFLDWGTSSPSYAYIANQIRRLFPVNVGLVVPPGLVVVEADSLQAEQEVRALGGAALDETPTRAPRLGRGPAWIFALPAGAYLRNRAHLGSSGAIDVRAPGHGILIAPPSRHTTGHEYSWIAGLAPWEVEPAPIPPPLLALICAGAPRPRQQTVPSVSAAYADPLSRRVRARIATRSDIRALWNGEGKIVGDTSRSGYDHALARALLRAGARPSEVAAALMVRPDAHRRDPEYANGTVNAALQSLGRTR